MLNMNLDMDITDFVTVGYKGLSEVIDGLGGIYIDVDSEELKHINNYQIGIAERAPSHCIVDVFLTIGTFNQKSHNKFLPHLM